MVVRIILPRLPPCRVRGHVRGDGEKRARPKAGSTSVDKVLMESSEEAVKKPRGHALAGRRGSNPGHRAQRRVLSGAAAASAMARTSFTFGNLLRASGKVSLDLLPSVLTPRALGTSPITLSIMTA